MITLANKGVYLLNGTEIIEDDAKTKAAFAENNKPLPSKEEAKKETMAYRILQAHNHSDSRKNLQIRFDKLTSHDITFVGILQTARASGLTEFPMPYVLTNCHNSLCAVGGTINEDDHMFGLSCAQKYGGIYVPAHQAVIHQYAREMLACVGDMILGSDSHTRYGALGTMAMGEGGPELVKQLLSKSYDIPMPEVVAVYLEGNIPDGVGPQDVAIAMIGAVFEKGYVNNKVMEFVGPGVKNLSADFRIGIDVMTTETTCLSSIWQTDEIIGDFYRIHGRENDYKCLTPGKTAYYDGLVRIDLSRIRPMIAMPFHPSNAYTIEEVNENTADILHEVEERAKVSLGEKVPYSLRNKIGKDGKLHVDQGIIAGCAGGGFENLTAAADILRGRFIGSGAFTLSAYPASMPIYMELVRNGAAAELLETGAVLKTAFCGPCFGAGDTPANGALSIRHSTRNFPNREGSKLQNEQIASVALMDARSIAATAANEGVLTPATDMEITHTKRPYHFDETIYAHRVYNGWGHANPKIPVQMGPNIKDWPQMSQLSENLLLKVVSEIHDPVTTTDELIPSGETSSYRSNPLGLAEFTLSRKDPAYVPRAKEVKKAEDIRLWGKDPVSVLPELHNVYQQMQAVDKEANFENTGIGSTIFARKPGDGSAREQAASCQKVLGGAANIAFSYATKRYRSNLMNWGMLPFILEEKELPFKNGDYIYIPGVKEAVMENKADFTAYVLSEKPKAFTLHMGATTETERQIMLDGCLINYYKNENIKKI